VRMRHGATVHSRLNVESVSSFEKFPKYSELRQLAEHGAQAHQREGFWFNRGVGDFLRPHACHDSTPVWEAPEEGRVYHSPRGVEGMTGFHMSPTHVACKRGDTKGRCCVDENDTTDVNDLGRCHCQNCRSGVSHWLLSGCGQKSGFRMNFGFIYQVIAAIASSILQ
jgi:hypothetical protein